MTRDVTSFYVIVFTFLCFSTFTGSFAASWNPENGRKFDLFFFSFPRCNQHLNTCINVKIAVVQFSIVRKA